LVLRIIEEIRVSVEKFNQQFEDVSFFPIFKDDYVYLYGSFDSKSLLFGRISQEAELSWNFWEFDYNLNEFKRDYLGSDLYTFDDVLNIGYQRLVKT